MSTSSESWIVDRVDRVIDGDTFTAVVSYVVGEVGGFELIARSREAEPITIRPTGLDTPERGEPGYREAGRDLTEWLAAKMMGPGLRVIPAGTDYFGRQLATVHAADDRSDTLSDHMILQKGWQPYIPGR